MVLVRKDGRVDLSSASAASIADCLLAFGQGVIRAIAPHVPAIKINIAFFERYYGEGIRAYTQLVREAQQAGLIVIGDVKRADIGHSTAQYAQAQLANNTYAGAEEVCAPDAVTLNPYFGYDGIKPWVEVASQLGRGMFVLVQTSNPSASQVQGLSFADGDTVCQKVGCLVEEWASADELVGACGYSCIGAVVSPRDLESTDRIRALMPHSIFLVPGFGAQGRTADEVARCYKKDGTGALVTASRSVIYAYQEERHANKPADDWASCVAQGAEELAVAIRNVLHK